MNASTNCAIRRNGFERRETSWIENKVGANPQIPPKCRDRSGCREQCNSFSDYGNRLVSFPNPLALSEAENLSRNRQAPRIQPGEADYEQGEQIPIKDNQKKGNLALPEHGKMELKIYNSRIEIANN